MTILQATMSDGTLVPVQADSQGRLVAEGLQGPEGPQGPQGPPGVGQLPPNPQNGDVLAWDNGLVWVSGIIPAGPPQTDAITGVSIQGGGTPTTTLTFASDKDLALFRPLDNVHQNSGYTPQTSAITGFTSNSLAPQTWSTGLTQTGAAGGAIDAPQEAFDGRNNAADRAYNGNGAANPNSMKWTPPSPLAIDFIWVQCGDGGATIDGLQFKINGSDVAVAEQQMQSGKSQGWYTYHKLIVASGSLSSVEIINNKPSGVILYGFSLNEAPYTDASNNIPGAIIDGQAIDLSSVLTFADNADFVNLRVGDTLTEQNSLVPDSVYGVIESINGNTITLSSSTGTWTTDGTTFCHGPDTTPATGVVGSIDQSAFTMTLSSSDESFPKRWIVGHGASVVGPTQARYEAGQHPHR